MDAVRFAEERGRMCIMYIGCKGCPLGKLRNSFIISCSLWTLANMGEAVPIVEEWAAAHPRKTRQDVFLEQWPNAQLSRAGDIIICPKQLCKGEELNELMAGCRGTNCDVCRREFYGKAVE